MTMFIGLFIALHVECVDCHIYLVGHVYFCFVFGDKIPISYTKNELRTKRMHPLRGECEGIKE